jgi:hypothetical protein
MISFRVDLNARDGFWLRFMSGKRLGRVPGQRPALCKSTARGPNIEDVIISEANLDFFLIGMWNNLTVLDLFINQKIDR